MLFFISRKESNRHLASMSVRYLGGGEKSFGPLQAVIMRHVATNVRDAVVIGSGHWLMEERPLETVALIRNSLDAASGASGAGGETLVAG